VREGDLIRGKVEWVGGGVADDGGRQTLVDPGKTVILCDLFFFSPRGRWIENKVQLLSQYQHCHHHKEIVVIVSGIVVNQIFSFLFFSFLFFLTVVAA